MDFSPSVYEHAAFLIGRTPWEVSRDAELLFVAHAEAFRRYGHTPIVVGIDIYNLEAEAYGGVIVRPHGTGIPAIGQPVCSSVDELAELPPLDPTSAGRIPMVIEVAGRLACQFPEADVRVPLSGPFSIAANLVGFETLLCEVLTRPAAAAAALEHLVEGQVRFCQAICRHPAVGGMCGCHTRPPRGTRLGVAFFESAAAPPLLSPELFRTVELPALRSIIGRTSQVVGRPVPCVIGGDTTPILEAILETGTGMVVCPIETDQEVFLRKIWDRTDVRVRVNTSSQVMVYGTRAELRGEFDRIVRLTAGRGNVCLGTGALPYETPPENVLWLKQLCAAHERTTAGGVERVESRQ
jgi:uroporphyrinogen decarboxylase